MVRRPLMHPALRPSILLPVSVLALLLPGTFLRAQEPIQGQTQDAAAPEKKDVRESSDLPVPFPAERYAALLEKSPFAIASAPPEVIPVSTENFATNWVLTGISKQRDNDGKELFTVFVRSRDLATRLVLSGDHPSDDGVSVVSVEEAAVPAKSAVFLKKGSETGRVEFDQATVAAAPSAPAVASAAPRLGGKNPSTVKPSAGPGKTAAPIPRPGMSAIPRPGGVPGASTPPGASGAQEPRRRIRPIEDAPTVPNPP